LRSIAGFSGILCSDYAQALDEQGKGYLRRMGRSAVLMGELIDALLALSRVARREMQLTRLDLGGLCRSVATQLQETHPQRSVTFKIPEGVWGIADPVLILQVLQNLLENSWKYTVPVTDPAIEFGCRQQEGETVYFVRDNGVGFDMEYVNKLFIPFQRLHSADEFEGTGIGLATVKRIIERHGGRVWAEGKVGEGATFFFTLRTG
jgi:light-regulated signal transduction histidine kinase (bacteriophytochrome)